MNKGVSVEVVSQAGETEHVVKLRPIGHWLYCRKCKQPDITGENGDLLLVLPEKSRDDTEWAQVLALGCDCGGPRVVWPKWYQRMGRHQRERYNLVRWQNTPLMPGDRVLFPPDDPFCIQRCRFDPYNYFIDEAVAICVWRE